MSAFLFHPGERRKAQVRSVADLAGVSMGEVIRRALDHALRPQVLDHLYPQCSGQWGAQRRADELGAGGSQ